MTDDTTTTQLAQDDTALESAVVDATFDLTENGEGEDEEVDRPWLRPGNGMSCTRNRVTRKKVDANLKARIASYNLTDRIYEIVIPMEDVVEFKQGRKQTVQKKSFPRILARAL